MKRLKEKVDPKILKICLYAIISAIIIFVVCLILFHSKGFFANVWTVIKAVLGPLVIGAVVCYLLTPIANFLTRLLSGKGETEKSWARPVAVLLTFLFVLILVGGLILLLVFFVYNGIKSIQIENIGQIFESIKAEITQFSEGIKQKIQGFELPIDNLETILSNAIGSAGGSLANTIGNIPKAASTILFSTIFSIYFLIDGKRIGSYLKRAFRVLSSEKTRAKLKVWAKDADDVFSGYIRGKIVEALLLGFVTSIAFLIAKVPYALVVGIFIGIVNLVPYVGNIVSYVILLLSYLVSGDFSKIWIPLIILTVILVIDAYIVCPKLLNRSILLHPLLIIVALIAGGAIGGLVGMLIATPILAFFKIQFDRYIEKREKASTNG